MLSIEMTQEAGGPRINCKTPSCRACKSPSFLRVPTLFSCSQTQRSQTGFFFWYSAPLGSMRKPPRVELVVLVVTATGRFANRVQNIKINLEKNESQHFVKQVYKGHVYIFRAFLMYTFIFSNSWAGPPTVTMLTLR